MAKWFTWQGKYAHPRRRFLPHRTPPWQEGKYFTHPSRLPPMLTLRGPYCVVTEGSVTTRHVMTARHRHNGGIDNPERRHKSWESLCNPPCAHDVLGTPHGEVHETTLFYQNQNSDHYLVNLDLGHQYLVGKSIIPQDTPQESHTHTTRKNPKIITQFHDATNLVTQVLTQKLHTPHLHHTD